jgi:DNA helicase HerA-like ATPase
MGFAPTRDALSRIAKEGRKYGVSLGLVTQRPSELDPTIVSQCSTQIAMRLSTERDQNIIRANTQDGRLEFLDFLSILGDRQAIIVGQGSPTPM